MSKKQILFIAFMFFGLFSLQAQSLELSLDNAKEYALQYNRTLKKAGLSVAEAKSARWEAISAGLPQAKASYNYQNMLDFKVDFGPTSFVMEPTQNAQLQVTQLLFSGSYWVGIQLSDIAKTMSVMSYKKTELDISKELTNTYYTILVAQETHDILSANYLNLQDLKKNTDEMVAVGVSEQTNADQLSVQVAGMENSIKQVERQIEIGKNMLRLQLGLDANAEVFLIDSLDQFVNDQAVAELLLEPFMLNSNYDMILLKENLKLAKKKVCLAKTAALPTVSAFYNFTYKIATSGFDMQAPQVLGITASIPLFTSGATYSKIKQAKYKLKSAELDVDNTTDQILIQEKQLRFNLKNAFESYKIQKRNIEVSNRVFANISLKYEQGVASGLDLTSANNNLLTAQSNYVSSLMQLLSAENELNNLLGKK